VTCREFAEFIADYLAADLSPEIAGRFEHHLTLCPNCRNYLEGYSAGLRLGRQVLEEDDAEAEAAGVPAELVRAILASRRAQEDVN
jgi:predicted anti-sigma-YlaC factor YlaD